MADEPDAVVALAPCGCLDMVAVDCPGNEDAVSKVYGRAKRGYMVKRITTQEVRTMDWTCPQHKKPAKVQQKAML